MKVITIKQPYATLIREGYKEYEFRTWKTSYRGEILIHAGLGIDKKAMKKFEYLNLEYPKGCIIAKCNLTDCVEITKEMKQKLKEKDKRIYYGAITNTKKKEYGFKLENIQKIEPIPIKGKLSLWEYDDKEKIVQR